MDRMNFNLNEQQAMITGASKGIEYAIAKQFAKEGCNLHIDIFRLASRVNRALAVNRRGVPTPIGTLSC